MEDQTQIVAKPDQAGSAKPTDSESKLLNVSVRAWLAALVIGTVCAMALMGMEVKEPLYTLAAMVAGVYFAQQKQTMPTTKP